MTAIEKLENLMSCISWLVLTKNGSTGDLRKKNGATFPVLSDPDKSVCKEYGVLYPIGLARRWTFYIDPEGIIQRIDKDVKPRTAGAQLVKNLQELQVPMAGGQ